MAFKKTKRKKRSTEDYDFKEDIDKELNLILFFLTFGVLFGVLGFAYFLNIVDTSDNKTLDDYSSSITGLVSDNMVNNEKDSNLETNYEISMKYSPEFLVEVSTEDINMLKANILKMKEGVKDCLVENKDLDTCINQESKKYNFEKDCVQSNNKEIVSIAKSIEKCKRSSETDCICALDFDELNGDNYYIINIYDMNSVAIYNYDKGLSAEAKEGKLYQDDLKDYLDNSIIIRDLIFREENLDNLVFDINENLISISFLGKREYVFYDEGKVLVYKGEGFFSIYENDYLEGELDSGSMEMCEDEDLKIYNFCTEKTYTYQTSDGLKSIKGEFAMEFLGLE